MVDTKCATAAPFCPARPPKPCLLCGQPGAVNGMYFPGPHSPAAPPPGKGRIVLYSLCERCNRRRQSLLEVVEDRIESDLRASGAI